MRSSAGSTAHVNRGLTRGMSHIDTSLKRYSETHACGSRNHTPSGCREYWRAARAWGKRGYAESEARENVLVRLAKSGLTQTLKSLRHEISWRSTRGLSFGKRSAEQFRKAIVNRFGMFYENYRSEEEGAQPMVGYNGLLLCVVQQLRFVLQFRRCTAQSWPAPYFPDELLLAGCTLGKFLSWCLPNLTHAHPSSHGRDDAETNARRT